MKMYKKSELAINHGLIVSKDGDIILPDARIIEQANRLETMKQQAEYLAKQPSATPMPSLEGFERKSIKDADVKFKASTPLMDKEAAKTMALMSELDDMALVEAANKMLGHFTELLEFVGNDFVVDCGNELYYLDTPTLGNLLELKTEDVSAAVGIVCGMEKDGITVRDDDDDELIGGVAIPATKENLDKIKEFFEDIIGDGCDETDPRACASDHSEPDGDSEPDGE